MVSARTAATIVVASVRNEQDHGVGKRTRRRREIVMFMSAVAPFPAFSSSSGVVSVGALSEGDEIQLSGLSELLRFSVVPDSGTVPPLPSTIPFGSTAQISFVAAIVAPSLL